MRTAQAEARRKVRRRERYRTDPEYRARYCAQTKRSREANLERTRAVRRASYWRNKETCNSHSRAYNREHREQNAARKKAWYANNREAIRANARDVKHAGKEAAYQAALAYTTAMK